MPTFAWLLALASQVLTATGFWLWNHLHHPLGNQLTGDPAGQLLAWGRLAGLLAAFGCLLQITLVGRMKWVERAFGLDRLTRIHHAVGFSLVVFLLAHPVLVTLGHAWRMDARFADQWVDFCRNWDGVLDAAIGLAMLLAAIALSVAAIRRRLRYETWRRTHLTIYVALALAFIHPLTTGSDLVGNRSFRGYWIALYAFTFANLIGYRVLRPLWLFRRHRFVVTGLTRETADVTSVAIGGRNLDRLRAESGQFVIVRFLAPGFRWEAHPFSISRPPDGNGIRLTIKQLGDYTRRIPSLPVGTRAILDGPHGIFTARRSRSERVLLIAGGIGITPIRSVAEDLLVAGRDAVLVYANRNRGSVVFLDELARLAETGRLRVIHVMSDDPDWSGERGTLTGDRVRRLVPDLSERDVYLCGPPPMMRILRADLRQAGVRSDRIFFERFAL
jgi:predicted ferric reductase